MKNYFKSAEVAPLEILAGDSVEITVRLVTGKDFIGKGSRIILDMPACLGYSRPSCYDQEDGGFVEVICSNPELRYVKGAWDVQFQEFPLRNKPRVTVSAQRFFVLDFLEGKADEGDEILIKWGYIRDGFGIGTKVTTIVPQKEFYNTIDVRYFIDNKKGLPDLGRYVKGRIRPVPDFKTPLKYRILPRKPESIRIIRKKAKALFMIRDRFCNVCPKENPQKFINENIKGEYNGHGVFEIKNPQIKISSRKLPLFDTPDNTNVFGGKNIYFGDMHTHSSISSDCIEREKMQITPDLGFEFAKNVTGLDFMAVTDHHNPSGEREKSKIGKNNWEKTIEAVKKHNKEGEFLAFPGFELSCERGDTVIVLNELLSYSEIDKNSMSNIKLLWEEFKERDYISIPHFHNPGRLENGKWYKCPWHGIEPVLEIYSCHGSYERENAVERGISQVKKFREDRNGKYFLQNRYQYGFVCNSDGHKGNPGINGLTAVYAECLTKDAIMKAIRKRHVYGTTNARIRLLFTVNGYLMGSVIEKNSNLILYISIRGERPFKVVDIFKNGELFKRFRPNTISFKTELEASGDENCSWYVRAIQSDDHIAYSSPVWCV